MSEHTPQSLNEWLGYMFPDELAELTRLTESLPPNPRVLNIGAGGGVSGATFLASRPDLHLTTVDIQQESSPFGCLEGERVALEKCGLLDWERYAQVCGDSKVVGKNWTGAPFDLIFIDGDHSFEGCKGDILAWLPHVQKGGIMAIHDYRKQDVVDSDSAPVNGQPHPKPWGGVDQAVDLILVPTFPRAGLVDSLISFIIDGALVYDGRVWRGDLGAPQTVAVVTADEGEL